MALQTPMRLIKSYFEIPTKNFMVEWKALTKDDRLELATEIATLFGIPEEHCDFTFVDL